MDRRMARCAAAGTVLVTLGAGSSLTAPSPEDVAHLELVWVAGDAADPAGASLTRIVDLDVRADGSVVVLDALATDVHPVDTRPEVLEFDQDGRLVGRIGAAGEGPGEYTAPIGLGIAPDGALLLLDPWAMRIHEYSEAGDPLRSTPIDPFDVLVGAWGAFRVLSDGTRQMRVGLRGAQGRLDESSTPALVRLHPEGHAADTIPLPPAGLPHGEDVLLEWTWDGKLLTAPRSGEYRVERWRLSEGGVAPEPELALRPEDAPRTGTGGGDGAGTAEGPPPIEALVAGRDGRIWVGMSPDADRDEGDGHRWHVYEPDGRLRGTVQEPAGFLGLLRRGDDVWGVRVDELGVPELRRYRVVWPGGG